MIRRLIEHWPVKLLSVAIALALWAGYVAESELATSIPAPLQFRNVPRDLEIVTDVPDRIYLTVRGPATRLSPSSIAQSGITLDLAGVTRPGEHTFTLSNANISLPSGLTVIRVVPSQLQIAFERRLTRQVKVEARFAGPPPEGYHIVETEIIPPSVRISGPESRVDSVDVLQTDPIDLSNRFGPVEFRLPVSLPDPHIKLEQEQSVTVRVQLVKSPAD